MKKHILFFALFIACFMGVSRAQTVVAPVTNPRVVFLTSTGAPCSGCLLSTFAAGTSSNLATYSESTGTTLNSNPITLGSDGSAVIYLTSASYKFVLKTSIGAVIWTQDNISWATPLTTFSGLTSTGNVLVNPAIAATGSVNQSSPTLSMCGFYFNISSLSDCWKLQDVLGTGTSPTSTWTLTHTGSGGTSTVNLPNVNLTGVASITTGPFTATNATVTTINKVTITQPATGSTLTIADGKTLTDSNSLTLAGTDGTTMTFPSTSATIARTDAANTFTGHQTIEGVTSTGATGTGNLVFGSAPTVTSPVVNTGVSQGSGLKHQRFGATCTTAASVGALCNTTETWTVAFADTNYTVTCTIDGAASGAPVVTNVSTKLAASFLVSVGALTASAAQGSGVDCIAMHD